MSEDRAENSHQLVNSKPAEKEDLFNLISQEADTDNVQVTEGGITDVTGTVPLGGSSDVGGTSITDATADIGASTGAAGQPTSS